MSDVTCAQCGEPWEVYGLRHEDYIDTLDELAGLGAEAGKLFQRHGIESNKIYDAMPEAISIGCRDGNKYRQQLEDEQNGKDLRNLIYRAVLSGKGCPSCGFEHEGEGEHRLEQLEELVFDGVTDDDPIDFL